MKLKTSNTLLATALVAVAGIASAQLPVNKVTKGVMPKAVKINNASHQKLSVAANNADIAVDFTVKGGSEANTATYSENFNAGKPSTWTFQDGKVTPWVIKQTTGDKAFSAIDPDDTGSLYIEGDYRVFNREYAYAYTPQVSIGQNASLNFYLGFSRNYDNYCRLYVAASTDNFENDVVELWNSGQATGELPWRWHEINIDLSELSGKTVTFRFTYGYGSDDEIFKSGGYFGDFTLDNIEVRTASTVDHIDVMTGDRIEFVDLTPEGSAVAWEWAFPGGVPETSTEQSPVVYYTTDGAYDVSLTVTDADGNTATVTKPAFVNVKGTAPVAKIGLPATFRYAQSNKHFIAPMAEVTFTDASTGFPTESNWKFSGTHEDASVITEKSGAEAKVRYHFLHDHTVSLESANSHGVSTDEAELTVEYEGQITNVRKTDYATTFDLDGRGEFPGTNTMKITAYAEKFSKPSRPVIVQGAYVYFNKCEAEEIYEQIHSIGVHLYTSENGLPGKRIDSWWWSVTDINYDVSNGAVATAFPFTDQPVVNDEFFIVVDGIPAKTDNCTVSFYMANFRGEGNTAYMLKDGEWVDVSTYFPAGKNHTSFYVTPYIVHSVISNLPIGADPQVTFTQSGGTTEYDIFSIMGYETPVRATDDWVRVINEPNGMTVDQLVIEVDPLPVGVEKRDAKLKVTDGVDTFEIPVHQSFTTLVHDLTVDDTVVSATTFTDTFTVYGTDGDCFTVTDLSGRVVYKSAIRTDGCATVDAANWATGIYLVKAGKANAVKVTKK